MNWEDLGVHPMDLAPDGRTLLVCNVPDHRLEIFDVSAGVPAPLGSIPVGLDPVSVRAKSASEAWVVNHISDSVSVVDLVARNVRATLPTLDEPCDVVFAGTPLRAFVSCSQANALLVFDPADLAAPPVVIPIDAEEPRAMAVSADGREVFVAIFESGNATTAVGGGIDETGTLGPSAFPPNAVNEVAGPYGGTNPPPNVGAAFVPPQAAGNPVPPKVSLIVKRDAAGRWRDDNGADWTEWVSGASAAKSGRVPGWDLPDRDLAIVDAATGAVRYATGLMNLCMALARNPATGRVTVVGTDATNEVRFEPNLAGRFLRVCGATVDPSGAVPPARADLNPHLDYTTAQIPQAQRDLSLGDPRGIVWNGAGTRVFVTGLGSNTVAVFDAALRRVGQIVVGEGPLGLVIDGPRRRLYVLNRFEASLSVIDTDTLTEVARRRLFDPTPLAIKVGRKWLYDTHRTSGLGHTACASCHIDARMDRLAWDLGDPTGAPQPVDQACLTAFAAACEDFHPMKGPMTTQTLQDIIGLEPFHWRGDREGLRAFNPAFEGLLGDDEMLPEAAMAEFEGFLATIHFPPNPHRNLDNTLPTRMPLPGHFTTGRFGPSGQPLPDGNARQGLEAYRTLGLDGSVAGIGLRCVTCHTLPTGVGTEFTLMPGGGLDRLPVGPNGERHHSLVSLDGTTNVSVKIPHLRNAYEKVGFDATRVASRAGFGFLHDGSVDSLERFVSEPVFVVTSDQQVADLVAFLLCFSGSDLPTGSLANVLELPGPAGRDTHAAVGRQVTLAAPGPQPLLDALEALALTGAIDLVAKGTPGGAPRGWVLDVVSGRYFTDRTGESTTRAALRALAAPGAEITYTAVPAGSGLRIGIDRDDDGVPDGSEAERGTDPADSGSR